MENELFVDLPSSDGIVRYTFTIVKEPFYFYKINLGSANMSLMHKDGQWKTIADDPKPIHHTAEEIGNAILDKFDNG